MRGLKSLMVALAIVGLCLFGVDAKAQCNAANGQCNAPVSSLQSLQNVQAQLNNGLQFAQLGTGASTAASASANAAPAVANFAAPTAVFGAYGANITSPAQVYLVMPTGQFAQAPVPPPVPEGVQANVAVAPSVGLFQFAAFPQVVAAGAGASTAASASASAAPAAALLPTPVVVPSAAVIGSSGCSSCGGGRARLGSRLFPRNRAVSRSRSVSRS